MRHDVLQLGPMTPASDRALNDAFAVHTYFDAVDPDALLADVKDRITAIATTGFDGASKKLIDSLPELQIISCFGVGVDAIDCARAAERGIPVTNSPDVLTHCVADFGMALTLAVARHIVAGDRYVQSGKWQSDGNYPLTTSLYGKPVGVVGMGRIGQAFAQRAAAHGMQVAYHGPREKPELDYGYYNNVKDLAAAVDFLVLTCPGGEATRHMIDGPVLRALGSNGYLINVARGSVVDETALIDAVEKEIIAGAGLDVFAAEPAVPEALCGRDNVVLQPHMASGSVETRDAMGFLVVENLQRHFRGEPLLTPV